MKTLNNKVLVHIIKQKNETSSGLILTTEKKSDVELCTVVTVPEGETELQVGNTVLASRVNMAEVSYGHLVDRKDILAIVD